MKYFAWLLLCGLLLAACDKDDDKKAFDIAQAQEYAGPHKNTNPDSGRFNYDAYMLREYQIATNPSLNEQQVIYAMGFDAWMNEPWSTRAEYLPPPYNNNINTIDIRAYYHMIGTYYTQFGYGWTDSYDPMYSYISGDEGDIWSAVSGDDPATIGFDGSSAYFYVYRDLIAE